MKKILLLFLTVLIVFDANTQLNIIYNDASLKHVTIFNQGANIERIGKIKVKEGANSLVIRNVSPSLINESIQIKIFSSDVIINSVQKQMNFLGANPLSDEIIALQDSLFQLKEIARNETVKIEVFLQEKDLLDQNKNVLKLSKEFIIDDLMDLTTYFRERMLDIESNLSSTRQQLENTKNIIKKIEKQINSINQKANNQYSNVIVQLTSKSEGIYDFDLSYNINNAGWTPFYDIRSKEIGSPIDLTYKAKVYQNSNENWENVKLSLSTGNLNQSNIAPLFNPKELTFGYPMKNKPEKPRVVKNYSSEDIYSNSDKISSKLETSSSSSDFTSINFNGTQIEYKIDLPYSISSKRDPILIDIKKVSLAATYDFYCYPKVDNDVFLMCHFKTIANQNFLAGNGQVFFKGKSIGKTYLDPLSTLPIIDLSLGRDATIQVERKILKKFSSEVKIGDKIKIERHYEITIKNNKSDSVNLKLIDQIPISNNKSISIELTEKSDAIFDKRTGKLLWNLNINSSQILKKNFNYTVKHPENKNILGLN